MSQIDPIEQPVEQNTPLDPLDTAYLFAPAAPFTNQTRHLTPPFSTGRHFYWHKASPTPKSPTS